MILLVLFALAFLKKFQVFYESFTYSVFLNILVLNKLRWLLTTSSIKRVPIFQNLIEDIRKN